MGRKLLIDGTEVGGNKVAVDAMKAALKAMYWVAQHPEAHADLLMKFAEADPQEFVLAVEEANPAAFAGPMGMTREQVNKVEDLLRASQLIPAIREVRNYTGCGLLAGKQCVEGMGDKTGLRTNGRWFWQEAT